MKFKLGYLGYRELNIKVQYIPADIQEGSLLPSLREDQFEVLYDAEKRNGIVIRLRGDFNDEAYLARFKALTS